MGVSALLKQRALEIGFDLIGIAPLAAWQDLEFSRNWVERGFGGEMRYLENPKREDPRRLLPSVKSIICVGLIYNTDYPYSVEAVGSKQKAVGSAQRAAGREKQPNDNRPSPSGRGRPPGSRGTGEGEVQESRFSSFDFPVSNFQFPVSHTAEPRAWISRYAWGRDYHEVMRARLEKLRAAVETLAPEAETRLYVDTGPIVERAFARYSGIGWMGKNTCLINQEKGSWFFLGVLLTSLELEPDFPAPDRCGSCTRCLEACPTGALVEPYVMDASRCISYFTIELKGSIPEEFRPAIGANIFGCDICQDVCPWNRRQSSVVGGRLESVEPVALSFQPSAVSPPQSRPPTTELPEFRPLTLSLGKLENGNSKLETRNSKLGRNSEAAPARHEQPTTNHQQQTRPSNHQSAFPSTQPPAPSTISLFNPSIQDLASMTESDFRRIFRHSPLKRAKYRGWLRNLCVAMGNSGDPRFIPWLEEARRNSEAVVREHAEWALKRLKDTQASMPEGTQPAK